MWDSIRSIKQLMTVEKTRNGGKMAFPGNMLRPGREYLYIAHLEATNGLASEPQGITVTSLSSDSTLLITIRGPTEISADRSYKYTAVPTLCSEGESVNDLDLEFMWNVEPEGAEWKNRYGKSVILRKDILRGGKTYTITVEASDFGNPPIKGEVSRSADSRIRDGFYFIA
ncbi:hypothetical protein SK128_006505 [Halocaridina rubra]|uniref:Uncharacterized protein n=1 Tax=Halocaridina rubra TaxID=373956 RepID=A0AAN8ZTL0_HALRR